MQLSNPKWSTIFEMVMLHITGPAGGPETIAIRLRHSARARRISLRVSRIDGQVTLTLPRQAKVAEGLAFAQTKAEWIAAALAQQPPSVTVAPGVALPVEGVARRIIMTDQRGPARLAKGELIVPGTAAQAAPRTRAFLRQLARDRLAAAADRHAAALGRPYHRLVLRDPRSRWGSCSSAGALMFSWRLIMAPPAVLDYVAAHEVAHLAEMNHSPRFWAVVAQLLPDHTAARRWLRREGSTLHRFRFED